MSIIEDAIRQAQIRSLKDSSRKAQALRPAPRKAGPAPEPADIEVQPQYSHTRSAQISPETLEKNRILAPASPMAMADAYNLLRTQVLEKTRRRNANTIMVTSPGPGEGKTTTAINLAISISLDAQQTALLVDMNLRSPKVSQYLGIEGAGGISDYFLRGGQIGDFLVNPGIGKLIVLPAGQPILGSTEIISSPRMRSLVKELKHRYPDRYVIFDCPHLLNMPDAHMFTSYVDSVLLVCSCGQTARNDLEAASRMLQDRDVLGVAYNRWVG